jgi:hypothetical protein
MLFGASDSGAVKVALVVAVAMAVRTAVRYVRVARLRRRSERDLGRPTRRGS